MTVGAGEAAHSDAVAEPGTEFSEDQEEIRRLAFGILRAADA
jgi:hypothetical protein